MLLRDSLLILVVFSFGFVFSFLQKIIAGSLLSRSEWMGFYILVAVIIGLGIWIWQIDKADKDKENKKHTELLSAIKNSRTVIRHRSSYGSRKQNKYTL